MRGKKQNVIPEYENRLKQPGQKPMRTDIDHAKDFATWVEETEALELLNADRVRADERLAIAPRVPSLLPWSVRSPLTNSAGRMKMHDYLLYMPNIGLPCICAAFLKKAFTTP